MTYNLKYFFKSILLNPIQGCKETFHDFKKDYHFKNHNNSQKKFGSVDSQSLELL